MSEQSEFDGWYKSRFYDEHADWDSRSIAKDAWQACAERKDAYYQVINNSHNVLVREIDIILNGKNAAQQASLCDLVGQIKQQAAELVALRLR